jgi:hypothetical protein
MMPLLLCARAATTLARLPHYLARVAATPALLCLVFACQALPPALPQSPHIAGTHSGPAAILGDTLSLVASPAAVSFALKSSGVANGSSPIVITTTYSGVSLLSSLSLYASFTSATSALSGGNPVAAIPASCILGQVTTGLPVIYTPFTQSDTLGTPGASLQLFQLVTLLSLSGQRSDSLNLQINLTTQRQLPAATYAGVLSLQLQAF